MGRPFYRADTFECRKSLGYLTRRLHSLMMPRAEARFADAELSFTQWVTLMALRDGIATTCTDIARHMNHDTGATTRLVDQLEQRGFVARSRSKADRRVVNLSLTPEGRAMTSALIPRVVELLNCLLEEFSRDEILTLLDLMTRLVVRLETQPLAAPEGATPAPAAQARAHK